MLDFFWNFREKKIFFWNFREFCFWICLNFFLEIFLKFFFEIFSKFSWIFFLKFSWNFFLKSSRNFREFFFWIFFFFAFFFLNFFSWIFFLNLLEIFFLNFFFWIFFLHFLIIFSQLSNSPFLWSSSFSIRCWLGYIYCRCSRWGAFWNRAEKANNSYGCLVFICFGTFNNCPKYIRCYFCNWISRCFFYSNFSRNGYYAVGNWGLPELAQKVFVPFFFVNLRFFYFWILNFFFKFELF